MGEFKSHLGKIFQEAAKWEHERWVDLEDGNLSWGERKKNKHECFWFSRMKKLWAGSLITTSELLVYFVGFGGGIFLILADALALSHVETQMQNQGQGGGTACSLFGFCYVSGGIQFLPCCFIKMVYKEIHPPVCFLQSWLPFGATWRLGLKAQAASASLPKKAPGKWDKPWQKKK